MSETPTMALAHREIFVADLAKMVYSYNRVLGFCIRSSRRSHEGAMSKLMKCSASDFGAFWSRPIV